MLKHRLGLGRFYRRSRASRKFNSGAGHGGWDGVRLCWFPDRRTVGPSHRQSGRRYDGQVPRSPTVQIFRTGRFRCEMTGGRHCLVIDGSSGADTPPQLRAKVTEWRELLQAIDAASASFELRELQRKKP